MKDSHEMDGEMPAAEAEREETDGAGSAPETDESQSAAREGNAEAEEVTAEKFAELRELYLRALAEAENVRRIAERERAEAARFGASGLARDLLPVYDNLKRALSSADDGQREHAGPLIEGVELTLRELLNATERHGLKPVQPLIGDAFDPKLHQAMFDAPSDKVEAGRIAVVMTEGFTMHDRLLRAAQVGISTGPAPKAAKVEKRTGGKKPAANARKIAAGKG